MQNENKKTPFGGKGYYIALIACLAAVGISGYVFVRTAQSSAVETSAPATISPAVSATASPEPSATQETAAETTQEDTQTTQTDPMEDAYEETMESVEWPLTGTVLSTFSQDTLTYSQTMADWRTHEGLDIAAEVGSLVSATQSGTVTAVYEDDFLGTVVMVSHSGDLTTLYANLAETPAVAVGDQVVAGETLGQVGDTALLETADPAHLHFEVYQNGAALDPMEYLPN
jgi:murein DD-endopeptidase MepM/ murein hydrolase activator NlpD